MLLGCRHGRIWNRSRNVILNSVLAVSTFLGYWMVLYDDYEVVSLCCLQAKKDKGTALQIILYTVWLILATACFLVTRVYLLRQRVVVFLVGIVDAFFTVKLYKVRTQLLGL
jgi:heme O synthase-like polyprenyltransferase